MNTVADFVERYLPERYRALCTLATTPTKPVVLGLHVIGLTGWSLVTHSDHLQVQRELSSERVLTVSMSEPDFQHLVLEHLPLLEQGSPMLAPKVMHWDEETRRLVTAMPGSILVQIGDQPATRRVLLTPGVRPIDFDKALCTIYCELSDLMAVRAGSQQIMELFLAGKLRIDGDVQLALALAGVLM
jgi:hypothetical protein